MSRSNLKLCGEDEVEREVEEELDGDKGDRVWVGLGWVRENKEKGRGKPELETEDIGAVYVSHDIGIVGKFWTLGT